MLRLVTVAAVGFFIGLFHGVQAASGLEKPNIIYILADDLGYGDLSCYGQSTLKTPNLDRMASEGLRFTQHYSGSTVCAPSRCVLLTGLHTGHTPIRGNDPSLLHDSDVTIAELLQGAGYRTGCVGKWGVGHPPPLNDPERNGFDFFYGYINMWHAHNFYPEFLIRNGSKVWLRNKVYDDYDEPRDREGRGVAYERIDYAPELIVREGLEFIERNQERPFFLYVAFNTPHANNEAGGDERAWKDGMEVPDHGAFEDKPWPRQEKGFARMIQMIDEDVGSILQKLEELDLDQKTLVLFSSDNGPHQEGGHRMSFFDSNGALRGMKRDLYEGGVRVPTIARWSGKIPAGRVSDHISGFQDMLPTFAELVGIEPPKTDGISLLPTLLDRPDHQRRHDHLYWEFYERGGRVAVRKGFWKAVRSNVINDPNSPIGLYDLSVDVGEQRNVADRFPEMVAEMARIMKQEHVARD